MSIKISRPDHSLVLAFMIKRVDFTGANVYTRVYEQLSEHTYSFPFAAALKRGFRPPILRATREAWLFQGDFNSVAQKAAFDDMLTHLAQQRVCILSLRVGGGKTFVAIRSAAHIGLKTLIITPTSKKELQPQWGAEITRFIPAARVQFLQPKTTIDTTADIFIASSHTVYKIGAKLSFIPFVIVDELHLVLSAQGYKCLLHIQPHYLLGVSATPYRLDGTNEMIELFFGTNQVTCELQADYEVNVIFTPFEYTLEKSKNGRINWKAVLSQQADNDARNNLIADIIVSNQRVKFLVLCKRVSQIKTLTDKCHARGLEVQAVWGDLSPVRDDRSLIGSIQKLGVGFSDSTFSALIIAADAKNYYIQYLGRVLRRPDARPVIYDIVDNCFILFNHYREREQVYIDSGARITKSKMNSLVFDLREEKQP